MRPPFLLAPAQAVHSASPIRSGESAVLERGAGCRASSFPLWLLGVGSSASRAAALPPGGATRRCLIDQRVSFSSGSRLRFLRRQRLFGIGFTRSALLQFQTLFHASLVNLFI